MTGLGRALAAPPESRACAAAARRVGDTIVLPAWCTVDLENEDRKARLKRLSEGQAHAPQFFEYVVTKASLKDSLPNFPADIPVLRVVFDEKVLFDFDHAEIRDDAKGVIDIIAASLRREPPDVAVFIAGHTDAKGDDDYNIALSRRRADAVAHALLDRGIGMSSVFRVAFGETMPVASNETDAGRAQNRRVEFLFAAKPSAAAVWLAEQAANTCYEGDPSALERCRRAITVAEEVRADTPSLSSVSVSTTIAGDRKSGVDLSGSKSVGVEIARARSAKVNLAPPRRYAIDLGRKSVSIDMPTR